jgi:hypothetical protein
MIQRIQSLYLSLTILLSLLFLKGGFINFAEKSGSVIKVTFSGIIRDTGIQPPEIVDKILPISLLIVFIPVLSFMTIFFYKNRYLQLWLTKILIIVVITFIIISGFYSYNIITTYQTEIFPGIKMVIPVLQLIFTVLADRAIKKDDLLVKSYDRLR